MGQRLKRSSLFFGQTAKEQEPPKPTLSGFYRGVGEAQAGAVQDVAKGVQDTTAKLPSEFGIKQTTEGKTELDTPFKPTVDLKTSVVPTVAPTTGYTTSAAATQAAEQAGKNVEQIAKEQEAAREALGKSTEESLTKAGEASKAAQERLTEKKLGERRETSELEKAAQDYRNVLQTTPGTSNVAAVANLMKFYDPKYQPLESSLRQGEIALARQQAGQTETALQQAEGERTGAIAGYKQAATQSYEDAKKLIDQEKQDKLKKIEEYYGGLSKKEKESGDIAAAKARDLKAVEEENAIKDLDAADTSVKSSPTVTGLNSIINAISGRAGDNWLNTRGNEVLGKIKGEITGLMEEANGYKNDPALTVQQRTQKVKEIGKKIEAYRGRIAGELAAFLGDPNTQPGDALDAAEQIMAAGLVNDLSDSDRAMIKRRIESDRHVDLRKNTMSSPEKLRKVYEAFGGNSEALKSAGYNVKKDESKWYEYWK